MRASSLVILFIALALPAAAQTSVVETKDSGGTMLLRLNEDGGLVVLGDPSSGTIPVSGAGTRLMWYPAKGAFRVGEVNGTQWDEANIGNYSFATGLSTTASGHRSAAMGSGTTASNIYDTAMGVNTTASGGASMAMGSSTQASGFASTAMGLGTTAQAYNSLVIGRYNIVSGTPDSWVGTDPLFVVGNGTFSTPSNALTLLKNGQLGIGTTAPGDALEVRNNAQAVAIRLKATASWPLRLEQTDASLFSIYNGGQARLSITAGGRVGIGTTSPVSKLEVAGTITATSVVQTSDARLKRAVRPIDDALGLVRRLRGVSYAWDRAQRPELEAGRRLGFLAQEVEEVLPEVVRRDGSGYLSVGYQEVVPVLVEALKEQQTQLEAQQATIRVQQAQFEGQQAEIKHLETHLARLEELLTKTAER